MNEEVLEWEKNRLLEQQRKIRSSIEILYEDVCIHLSRTLSLSIEECKSMIISNNPTSYEYEFCPIDIFKWVLR